MLLIIITSLSVALSLFLCLSLLTLLSPSIGDFLHLLSWNGNSPDDLNPLSAFFFNSEVFFYTTCFLNFFLYVQWKWTGMGLSRSKNNDEKQHATVNQGCVYSPLHRWTNIIGCRLTSCTGGWVITFNNLIKPILQLMSDYYSSLHKTSGLFFLNHIIKQ